MRATGFGSPFVTSLKRPGRKILRHSPATMRTTNVTSSGRGSRRRRIDPAERRIFPASNFSFGFEEGIF